MKKIAFVIQRYGENVVGGSESYCRQISERLCEFYDVDILTSKASSYEAWANDIDVDIEQVNGVTVRRFATCQERKLSQEITGRAFGPNATLDDGIEWLKAQGPYCPDLVDYVRDHCDDYDVFILVTYLYYPTVMSSFYVGNKSMVIPTAHDEFAIYQPVFAKLFENTAAWYFLTPEEKKFVEGMFPSEGKILGTGNGGVGIVEPEPMDGKAFREKYGLGERPFMVYAGRVNPMKGCERMFRFFFEYLWRHPDSDLQLVIMGSKDMEVPDCENFHFLGFVSEEEKFCAMSEAVALLQPSENESLSIVLLESLAVGTPVIANAKCEVLKGHCLRSNAGLYYETFPEYEGAVDFLLSNSEAYATMSANAKRYIDENYSWEAIIAGLRDMIEQVSSLQ